jgi:uroporphyrinogen-III synthase
MRLLVTRTEPDATATAAELRSLGHEVLVQPMLHIEFAPAPADLPMPAAIVVTSRNAVRAVERWPGAPRWHHLPVFAVGIETAALARSVGFSEVRVGMGNAAALVDLVANDFDRNRGTILYPTARDRAVDLVGPLSAAGYAVKRVEAYRAVPAPLLSREVAEAIQTRALDGVLFFSRRTAATFCALVKKAGLSTALGGVFLFALSEPVAEPLRDLGAGEIRIAGRPEAAALFALLSSHE